MEHMQVTGFFKRRATIMVHIKSHGVWVGETHASYGLHFACLSDDLTKQINNCLQQITTDVLPYRFLY